MLLRRGGVVAVCCCLLQLCGNADASLAKLVCPQADACKWSTFASSAGRSLSLRAQELARAPNHQYAELAHQHTRKKDKTRHLLGVRRSVGIRVRVPDHATSVRNRRRVRRPEFLLPLRRTIMRISHCPAIVARDPSLGVVMVDRAVEGRLRAADAAPGVGTRSRSLR